MSLAVIHSFIHQTFHKSKCPYKDALIVDWVIYGTEFNLTYTKCSSLNHRLHCIKCLYIFFRVLHGVELCLKSANKRFVASRVTSYQYHLNFFEKKNTHTRPKWVYSFGEACRKSTMMTMKKKTSKFNVYEKCFTKQIQFAYSLYLDNEMPAAFQTQLKNKMRKKNKTK